MTLVFIRQIRRKFLEWGLADVVDQVDGTPLSLDPIQAVVNPRRRTHVGGKAPDPPGTSQDLRLEQGPEAPPRAETETPGHPGGSAEGDGSSESAARSRHNRVAAAQIPLHR